MVYHTTRLVWRDRLNLGRTCTILFHKVPHYAEHAIRVDFHGNPSSPKTMTVRLIGGRPQIKINVRKLAEVIWQHLAFERYQCDDEKIQDEVDGIRVTLLLDATDYLRAVGGIESAYGKKN